MCLAHAPQNSIMLMKFQSHCYYKLAVPTQIIYRKATATVSTTSMQLGAWSVSISREPFYACGARTDTCTPAYVCVCVCVSTRIWDRTFEDMLLQEGIRWGCTARRTNGMRLNGWQDRVQVVWKRKEGNQPLGTMPTSSHMERLTIHPLWTSYWMHCLSTNPVAVLHHSPNHIYHSTSLSAPLRSPRQPTFMKNDARA